MFGRYDRSRKAHERLLSGVGTLAEALGLEVPPLEAQQEVEVAKKMGISVHGAGGDGGDVADDGMYIDVEQRAFYETLPDLRSVLPAVLFGDDGAAAKGSADAEGSRGAIEALLKGIPSLASKEVLPNYARSIPPAYPVLSGNAPS